MEKWSGSLYLKAQPLRGKGRLGWDFIRLKGLNFLISEMWDKTIRQSR